MKAYYQSPVGILELEEKEGYITSLCVVEQIADSEESLSPLLKEAICQLEEYFAKKRFSFDLPVKQEGTQFQQKAWQYLQTIPYGQTVSYKQEAHAIGSPSGYRAVGSANGRNNIAIIVPCHRVVNEGGSLGGYAYGLEMKKYLLDLEKNGDRANS